MFIRLEKLIDLVEFSKLAAHRYPPASQGELQDSLCVEAAVGGALPLLQRGFFQLEMFKF